MAKSSIHTDLKSWKKLMTNIVFGNVCVTMRSELKQSSRH